MRSHPALERLGGLFELVRLALGAGAMRRASSYWRWRRETAFGTDASRMPLPHEQRRAVFAFGRWVWRMKRL